MARLWNCTALWIVIKKLLAKFGQWGIACVDRVSKVQKLAIKPSNFTYKIISVCLITKVVVKLSVKSVKSGMFCSNP